MSNEAVNGGQIHGLSTLGEYQEQDWANQFDLIRARLEHEDGIKPVNGGRHKLPNKGRPIQRSRGRTACPISWRLSVST